MKLSKRLVSLLLALCMVFLAIPAFAMPITAAEGGDPFAEKKQNVSIFFRLPDARGAGALGTMIAERSVAPGFAAFTLPTSEECLMCGLDPTEILGWYSVDANGTFRDAQAFSGTYITADMTFYPYMKSQSFSFDKASHFPIFTTSGGSFTLTGFRGGWQVGQYTDKSIYQPFTEIPTASVAQGAGKYHWDFGGIYLATGYGGNSIILSKTTKEHAVALSWTALVDGQVDIDFNGLTFLSGAAANAAAYIAVAHNDTIIWPASAAGQKVSTAGSLFEGWYKAGCGNASKLSSDTKLNIPEATYTARSVKAGDTIRIVLGRDSVSNISTIKMDATVSYTETTSVFWNEIVTKIPVHNPGTPLDAGNSPLCGPASTTAPEITYPGPWQMITYPSWASITSAKTDLIEYYTKSSEATDFLTSIKDYGSDTAAPFLVNYDIGPRNSAWGKRWDFVITNNGTGAIGTGGYRYTAEHTGYVNISFSAFMRSNYGFNCNFSTVRAAIFVDGEMVWPTAGGDPTDMTKWAKPYETVNEKQVDVSAALNATIPKQLFVRSGQKVDFLITAAEQVNVWNGAGNIMQPAITYDTVLSADFQAYASLGEALAMTFTANTEGGSFIPTANRPYLLSNTLNIALTYGNEEQIAPATVTNGKLTTSVTGIVARCMNDTIGYQLTADIKMPDGTTDEDVILESGSISPADYMKDLIATYHDNAVRDLALSTLRYGAEAQRYFNYNTSNPADAGVENTLSFTTPAPNDYLAITGEGDYVFTAASLIAGDLVTIKLYVDTAKTPLNETLYVSVNNGQRKIALEARDDDENGNRLKAFIPVPYKDFSTDMTFEVCKSDGAVVSHKLTYSVETYAARTAAVTDQAALIAAIRAAGIAAQNYCNLYAPTPEGEIVTRVGILSDLHAGRANSYANQKIANALQQVDAFFGGETDIIIFPGDLTHDGKDSEFASLVEIVTDPNNIGKDTRLGFVTGNHEFYRKDANGNTVSTAAVLTKFQESLSSFHDEDGVDHTIIVNGIYFIGLSARSEGLKYGAEAEAYLRKQVAAAAAANPEAPIILYSHIGNGDMSTSTQMALSAETTEFLKNYPQIIWFSGHTHAITQDPNVIGQKYYTSIQAPTTGGQISDSNFQGSNPAHNTDHSQGMMMTVSDTNVVKIYRYDFATGKQVGETWTIDIPAIQRSTANFTYSIAERKAVAAKPSFGTSTIRIDELTTSNAAFTLPLAHINDTVSDDAIVYYHVFVMDENNKMVTSSKIFSEYYRGERAADSIAFSVAGLTPNTTYTMRVMAESEFEKYSDALSITFTTPNKGSASLDGLTELLSVDYTTGSATDANGHDIVTYGQPKLAAGKAADFDGSSAYGYHLTAADLAAMKSSLTIETVVTIDSSNGYRANINWEYCGLVSNVEYGGFGISYIFKNQTLRFTLGDHYTGVFSGSSYSEVKLEVPVELDKPLHIVATATGNFMCIYINGQLAGSMLFDGDIYHTPHSNNMYVGGDSAGSGGMQSPTFCDIAYVNLYAEGVSPDQAALMYANYSAE